MRPGWSLTIGWANGRLVKVLYINVNIRIRWSTCVKWICRSCDTCLKVFSAVLEMLGLGSSTFGLVKIDIFGLFVQMPCLVSHERGHCCKLEWEIHCTYQEKCVVLGAWLNYHSYLLQLAFCFWLLFTVNCQRHPGYIRISIFSIV